MPRILIVDDDEETRYVLARVARWVAPDADIQTASNGREALEIFQEEQIDLIISDYQMPFMSGIELVRTVRSSGSSVPVVVVSGELTIADVSLQAGASAFYPKPITTANVRQIMCNFFL